DYYCAIGQNSDYIF
nr:immunoglobulin light chain junction region [Macaca mulatta]